MTRPPLPPFDRQAAIQKVRLAEDAWNSRDPERVAAAYTSDGAWRNRSEFFTGTKEIVAFLTRKWARERDYRLIKELWVYSDDRIAVQFAYEWHDATWAWFRSNGNENWAFADDGRMHRLPRSTICRLVPMSGSFTGRRARAPRRIPDCRT